MHNWIKNQISKLYSTASAPVEAIQDALSERLKSVRDTASLLYNITMEKMGYGHDTLKNIVEKKAEREHQEEQQKEQQRRKR